MTSALVDEKPPHGFLTSIRDDGVGILMDVLHPKGWCGSIPSAASHAFVWSWRSWIVVFRIFGRPDNSFFIAVALPICLPVAKVCTSTSPQANSVPQFLQFQELQN
jgi:hypothetical protein